MNVHSEFLAKRRNPRFQLPPGATDEADLADLVPQFTADALAQRRLLVDNPARLYGFE